MKFSVDQCEEGPTINGRPAIDIGDVQKWFSDSVGHEVSPEKAAEIAQAVNHIDLFRCEWHDDPVFKEERKNNRSKTRINNIKKALETLSAELPLAVADTKRPMSDRDWEGQLLPYLELEKHVNSVLPLFQRQKQKSRGREKALWHNVARNLATKIKDALCTCGMSEAGFGKSTSPGVKILKLALSHLQVEASEDTIVDALRPVRRRQKGK